MSRKITALIGSTTIASAIAVAVLYNPAEETSARNLASLAQETPIPALSAKLEFRPQAGKRYTYQFERKIRFSGAAQGAMPEIVFHGNFFVDVLATDKTGFDALLSETILESNNKLSPLLKARVHANGEAIALTSGKIETEEELQLTNITKDLAANWLFPMNADTVGSYSSRFEQLSPVGENPRQRKIKLAYTGKFSPLPEIEKSLHLLLWNSALSLPQEEEGGEITRLGQGISALSAESHYHLRLEATGPIPNYTKAMLAKLNAPSTLKLATSKEMNEHPDYAKLDWSQILAQLASLDSMKPKERLDVFGDLLRYLRLHPEKIAEVAEMLRAPALLKKGGDSALFKTLVGALATVATPEAQAALRDTYDSKDCASSGKGAILTGLTTTQATLDANTRDFLTQNMRAEKDPDLAHGAAFALGSALQTAPDDPQSARAISAIQQSWADQVSAGNTMEQLATLDVMGNSGRADFLPLLADTIKNSKEPAVKAKAVFALRFQTSPSAGEELVQQLTDQDPGVREAAASALGYVPWRERYRRPLEHCAANDTLSRIQKACGDTLSQNGQSVAGNP